MIDATELLLRLWVAAVVVLAALLVRVKVVPAYRTWRRRRVMRRALYAMSREAHLAPLMQLDDEEEPYGI